MEHMDMLNERAMLSFQRIEQMKDEHTVEEPYADFFKKVAAFILDMRDLYEKVVSFQYRQYTIEELAKWNRKWYEDILQENYETSYANPAYAVEKLGAEYGKLLCFLYSEIRGMIAYAHERDLFAIAIRSELFIEVYNCFEGVRKPPVKTIKNILYWFISDYSDVITEKRIENQVDAGECFARDIILQSDLTDLRYLYQFGEYITENELRVAAFLNQLPQEKIDKMADTYTEGFRMGFVNAGKPLDKKKTVNIRYHLGFERVIKKAIENFENMGLRSAIYRKAVDKISPGVGYEGAEANKQYTYDHKEDRALFLDKAYVERRMGVLRTAYEKYKTQAAAFAGPAVMEIFGEIPFVPVSKKEAYQLNKRQQKLAVELANGVSNLTNEYIKGEERSFTIIAFPMPEIGESFEEIFEEIIRINTLDYKLYQQVQQKIIDALDQGEKVHIQGMNGNETDLTVQLYPLKEKEKETIFENCVADVNIPVGEVFTSPVLKGTNGVLHVSRVYLNELEYQNIKLIFRDGMIQDYSCTNFDDEEENRRYIQENVLYHHDTLPMGEFAIGTNTTAYVMTQKYNLAQKMPILIAEKMGPHFAVGDTCYSREEDVAVYNPDGKEIVARANEISQNKTYYNCHTDITIPYDELGSIRIIKKNGEQIPVIENGRFVLPGTEVLNQAF